MLGKVLKFEFRDTAKVMGLIYALMALVTVMGTLAMRGMMAVENGTVDGSTLLYVLCSLTFVFYVICIIVGCILMYVYNCIHYYKSMYSAQGYLTHTLPVSTNRIFFAKFFTFLVWNCLTGLLAILSVFCLVYFGLGSTRFHIMLDFINWDVIAYGISSTYGMNLRLFFTVYALNIILGQISSVLFFITAFAFGQLSNQHKIGASILAGFVMYVIMQIASFITALFGGGLNMFTAIFIAEGSNDYAVQELVSRSMILGLFLTVTYCVAFYLITTYINNKKLNLE